MDADRRRKALQAIREIFDATPSDMVPVIRSDWGGLRPGDVEDIVRLTGLDAHLLGELLDDIEFGEIVTATLDRYLVESGGRFRWATEDEQRAHVAAEMLRLFRAFTAASQGAGTV